MIIVMVLICDRQPTCVARWDVQQGGAASSMLIMLPVLAQARVRVLAQLR
jgi:hypothetical protein